MQGVCLVSSRARRGLDERQASLQLRIHAEGEQSVRLAIIFEFVEQGRELLWKKNACTTNCQG